MARPRKIKTEEAPADASAPVVESELEQPTETVADPDPTKCFNCGRTLNVVASVKGDHNQFKFCSVECHNANPL